MQPSSHSCAQSGNAFTLVFYLIFSGPNYKRNRFTEANGMKLGMECIQCLYFHTKHTKYYCLRHSKTGYRLQTSAFLKRKEPYLNWFSF